MENKTTVYAGISTTSLLGIVFIILKLTKFITWSWWWVLFPFYWWVVLLLIIAMIWGAIVLFF